MQDYESCPVTEAEAASILGFASVEEMRRWDTEMGRKVAALQAELREACGDRDQFRWKIRRMQVVLERVDPVLDELMQGKMLDQVDPDGIRLRRLRLAIGVVCGRALDWRHKLKGWWEEAP